MHSCPVTPVGCNNGQPRCGLLDHQAADALAAVVREHGARRLPYTAGDFGGEFRRELGFYCQDGLVGGVGPVFSEGRVEVAAISMQDQRGAQDQALG